MLTQMHLNNVMNCTKDMCPLFPECHPSDKCTLHAQYLENILSLVAAYVADKKLNDHGKHVVGTTLLPLYSHLFKFQLEEMQLDTTVVHGKTIYMHPVFKEIRATTKTIMDIWKSLGFGAGDAPFMSAQDVKGNYYAMMAQDDEPDVEDEQEELLFPSVQQPAPTDLKPTGTVAKAAEAVKKLKQELKSNEKKAYELEFGPEDVSVSVDYDPLSLPVLPASEEGI